MPKSASSYAAARDGDLKQIKSLAQQCDINARDEIGWCAVHRAAVHGRGKGTSTKPSTSDIR